MKKLLVWTILVMMTLFASGASAQGPEWTGTVTATEKLTFTAPYAGKVEVCPFLPGDRVAAGDVLLSLAATKVYAQQPGTVRLFGQPGDSVEALVARYGGVAYVEPAQRYTISASTRNAYNSDDTKLIHPGEKVYLRGASNTSLKGVGVVTTVSGTSFTVEIEGAPFTSGASVNVYRTADYGSKTRIGSGKVAQAAPVAYSTATGTGYLVKTHVENGLQVAMGDLLFETVEVPFTANGDQVNQVKAEKPGVIASLSTGRGQVAAADAALMEVYADEGLRIAATVPEADLPGLQPGDQVQLALPGAAQDSPALTGTVEKISMVADEDTTYGVTYTVYIIPQAPEAFRYGMTVSVWVP